MKFSRLLLRLYPAEFRAEYGPEMDELLTARAKREPAFQLVKDLVIDVLRTAPKEHLSMWHKDIKHSLRALRNAPAFTAVASCTGFTTVTAQFPGRSGERRVREPGRG